MLYQLSYLGIRRVALRRRLAGV
ncbi:protein of unknown function [Methylorubrum extorquens]|uniref:Uncharacterized protein n=1 Tax=Methylorubrum extorquens TaxID=408 RepID=A0A2N9AR17_METEX|nr:protein of unknown function [Methylorubrum extorquens]